MNEFMKIRPINGKKIKLIYQVWLHHKNLSLVGGVKRDGDVWSCSAVSGGRVQRVFTQPSSRLNFNHTGGSEQTFSNQSVSL